MTATRGLLLVEPTAFGGGGHWSHSLPLLADAASKTKRSLAVVAVGGIDQETRTALERLGATVLTAPARFSLASVFMGLSRILDWVYRELEARNPHRSLPYQLQLFQRCFAEAASLRIGRSALGNSSVTAVVLTASVTLHATATGLSGMPHIRYLHDVCRHESRAVRAVDWLFHRNLRRTTFFCTTGAIEAALHRYYPRARAVVQPYALEDPASRLREEERATARALLQLPADDAVGSLIGASWQAKDFATVTEALKSLNGRITLVVAGHPIREEVIAGVRAAHNGRLKVLARYLSAEELHAVYAASDFTIVSRTRSGKESGVVLEAVSRGVPIVVSEHDDALSEKLRGKEWARLFPGGDAQALASVLEEVSAKRLSRPPTSAAAELGMLQARGMLDQFDRVARIILEDE